MKREMKRNTQSFTIIGLLVMLFAILPFSSCDNDDDTIDNNNTTNNSSNPPTITKSYYISAKFDSEWKLNESNSEVFLQTSNAIGWTNFNGSMNDKVGIDINSPTGHFPSAIILNLEGDTIPFGSGSKYATFFWQENGVNLSSYYANDQSDSYMYIEDVTSDGTSYGYDVFILKGNFECKIADDSGSIEKNITEGIFVIRVTEEDV